MAVAAVLTAAKIIPAVVSRASSVYSQLQKAKRNREQFEELADHVKEVADILKRLEEQGVGEDVVKKGLEIFQHALESAEKLLEGYGRSRNCNTCMHFIKARGWEDRFNRVNDKLGKAKQHLTLVLQVEQRGQSQANECKRKEDEEAKAQESQQKALVDHKGRMLKQFDRVFEGLEQRGTKTPLNKIYTQLYITEGESNDVNNEHEVWQMDKLSRKPRTHDTPIDCNDIFKASSGHIRTVMTKGIAGIGKTVSVQKFILDWAYGEANQKVHLMLLLPFRELNLLKDDEYSLHKLLLEFYPELGPLSETCYNELQVVFIFDGIDESRLPLNFQSNKPVSDVMKAASLDVLVTNLIKGNLLRNALLWMTSRPAAAGQIPSEYVDRITEVRGFKKEQKEEYFRKRIDDPVQAEKIITHIKTTRSLYIMCHIPVFCYIAATVLQEMLGHCDSEEIPSTLTEMYIQFLIIQLDKKNQKYDGVKPDRKMIMMANQDTILKLAKLAFENLEQGTILFDEDSLEQNGINLVDASVQSGLCTEIVKEEPKFAFKTFYCFVHLSLQEFLAALFVFVSFMNADMGALKSFLKSKPKKVFLYLLLKSAVDKSLQSKNGHWDLFLRFLLGISLESSQKLLDGLVTRPSTENSDDNSKSLDLIMKYIKDPNGKLKSASPDRFINLINCLSEMKDRSLQNELQSFLTLEKRPETELSPAHCSALADVLLKSDEILEEFDIDKYNTKDDGRQRLIPVLKWSKKAWLTDCNLNEESSEIVMSVLQSASSYLRELHLDRTTMTKSGMMAICGSLTHPSCMLERLSLAGCHRFPNNLFEHIGSSLQSLRESRLVYLDLSCCRGKPEEMKDVTEGLMNCCCKVETLILRNCGLSSSHCEDLASILCSSASNLKELDLRENALQDSGVELLSSGLKSSQCTLEKLRLSPSNLTEASWRCLTSVFQGELDLSESRLMMSELEQLSAALISPECRLNTLRLNQCFLKDEHCKILASVLGLDGSHLKELDLSDNDLQDSGVELLSSGLKSSQCTLEILRLSFCGMTEKGCEFLASALRANPSHLRELDLSYNHPGEMGVKLLSERKDDPDCKLHTLNIDHNAECWLKSGLKNYACCSLTLDPGNHGAYLGDGGRTLTVVFEEENCNPNMFTKYEVLCREGLRGRCYWEVEWKAMMAYTGATYKRPGGKKEQNGRLGFNETSWRLLCEDVAAHNTIYKSCYTASHDSKASPKVSVTFDCNRVGVFLDWEAGTLSFYSISSDTLTHLHTFHHRFTEPLYPAIGLAIHGIMRGQSISLCQT